MSHDYRTVTPSSQSQSKPAYIWEPVRSPSVSADGHTPLFQAGVVGGLVLAGVVLYLVWQGESLTLHGLVGAGLLAVIAMLATFVWRVLWAAGTVERAIERAEQVSGVDINRDGAVGHPVLVGAAPPPNQTRLERDWLDLAAWFVEYSFKLNRTGEKELCAHRPPRSLGQGPHGRLSQAQYDELRDTFLRAGYAFTRTSVLGRPGWTWKAGLTPEHIVAGLRQYSE